MHVNSILIAFLYYYSKMFLMTCPDEIRLFSTYGVKLNPDQELHFFYTTVRPILFAVHIFIVIMVGRRRYYGMLRA